MLEDLDTSWSHDRATPLLPPVAQGEPSRSLLPCAECGCAQWLVVTRSPLGCADVPRVVAVQCEDCGRSRAPLAMCARRQ